MTEAYDDIIDLPHPVSKKYPPMPASDRAAQFAPFAALTGHGEAVRETARLTDRRVELDEGVKARLDQKLRLLTEHRADHPEVRVTYFQADSKKDGGSYQTASGLFKRVDDFMRVVILTHGEQIPIDDIYEIEGELLRQLL